MIIIAEIVKKVQHIYGIITFRSSKNYWVERYKRGGNSGKGSHLERLVQFKADVINRFVETNGINTIIEYGCGDGHQLTLAKYPRYSGYDISPEAIGLCKNLFINDPLKSFYIMSEYKNEVADLTLSLDVLYHLVEDGVFETYMKILFTSSTKYVIIYSTDYEEKTNLISHHIRHRHFTKWVENNMPNWILTTHIPNPHRKGQRIKENHRVDFFIYQRINP